MPARSHSALNSRASLRWTQVPPRLDDRLDHVEGGDGDRAGAEELAEKAFRDERLEGCAEVAADQPAEAAEQADPPVRGDVAATGQAEDGERGGAGDRGQERRRERGRRDRRYR
jgi:hypothetical protein